MGGSAVSTAAFLPARSSRAPGITPPRGTREVAGTAAGDAVGTPPATSRASASSGRSGCIESVRARHMVDCRLPPYAHGVPQCRSRDSEDARLYRPGALRPCHHSSRGPFASRRNARTKSTSPPTASATAPSVRPVASKALGNRSVHDSIPCPIMASSCRAASVRARIRKHS